MASASSAVASVVASLAFAGISPVGALFAVARTVFAEFAEVLAAGEEAVVTRLRSVKPFWVVGARPAAGAAARLRAGFLRV